VCLFPVDDSMNVNFEEIRTRAYRLWELAGRPEGRADEFWEEAKRELEYQAQRDGVRTPDNL
jgi:hypothetical protein